MGTREGKLCKRGPSESFRQLVKEDTSLTPQDSDPCPLHIENCLLTELQMEVVVSQRVLSQEGECARA